MGSIQEGPILQDYMLDQQPTLIFLWKGNQLINAQDTSGTNGK